MSLWLTALSSTRKVALAGLVAWNSEGLAELLRRAHYAFVSDGVTALADNALGFRRGFIVADPDGHVMRVAEY